MDSTRLDGILREHRSGLSVVGTKEEGCKISGQVS